MKNPKVGDVGTSIVMNLGTDVSNLTEAYILAQKPDESFVKWTAAVYTMGGKTRYIRYVTVFGDLDQVGLWRLQPEVYAGTSEWHGEIVEMTVESRLGNSAVATPAVDDLALTGPAATAVTS